MSLVQKRPRVVAVVSLLFLVAGVAMFHWGQGSFDQALQNGFTKIDRLDADDVARSIFPGMGALAGGVACAFLGIFFFLLSLAIWIRKPPPGSRLTFRGWKAPAEISESYPALDKAAWAAFWGFLASQAWLTQLCIAGVHPLKLHSGLIDQMQAILLLVIIVFYAVGIRLCRRRDPSTTKAVARTWKLALVLNYGALLAFLCFIGTVLALRSRA